MPKHPDRSPRINLSNTAKGLVCLVMGTLTISTVPVVSKVVLQEMPSLHFTVLWMATALVYACLLALVQGPITRWHKFRAAWKASVTTGLVAIAWVFFYFRGVELLDPAVVAFVINSRIVWAVGGGMLLLGERYRPLQLLGMFAVACGVIVIFMNVEGSVEALGVTFVLIAAAFYVIGSTVVKSHIKKTGVAVALIARFAFPFFVLLPVALSQGPFVSYLTTKSAVLIAGGAFLGPFLSFLLIYTALRYLPVGLHTIFQSASVFYTALLSFAVFGTVPPLNKIIGGLIIVSGMVVVGFVSVRYGERPSNGTRPRGPLSRFLP